ncbi:unnamed protein product [Cunninghamella echinulata]
MPDLCDNMNISSDSIKKDSVIAISIKDNETLQQQPKQEQQKPVKEKVGVVEEKEEESEESEEGQSSTRPTPGTSEWHEQRKENHKKVERKRREAINSAMANLASVIPGEEKNKSKVLNRAVEHIRSLNQELAELKHQLEQYQSKENDMN